MSAPGAAPHPTPLAKRASLLACASAALFQPKPPSHPVLSRPPPAPHPRSPDGPRPPPPPARPARRRARAGDSAPGAAARAPPGQRPGRLPRAHPLDEEAFLEHPVLHVAARASRACGRSRCAVPAPPARAAPRRSLGTRAGGACLAGVQSRRPRGLPGRKSLQVGVSDAVASAKVR